jgi:signal transduction histidine kinase
LTEALALEPRSPFSTFPGKAVLLLGGTLALGGLSLLLPEDARRFVLEGTGLVLAAATVWVFLKRGRSGEPGRRFFLLIAAATAFHAAWSATRLLPAAWTSWMQLSRHPGLLAIQVVGPLLQVVAVLSWPSLRTSRALRWREGLDALILASSLFMAIWLLGLGDLQASGTLPTQGKVVQVVFSLDYTILMGATLFRGLDAPGRFRGPLGWLLGGYALVTAGNLTWMALYLRGAYHSGHPLDTLQLLVQAVFLLAGLARSAPRGDRELWEGTTGNLLEPYLPICVALPLWMHQMLKTGDTRNQVTLYLGFGMILAVLIRQVVALGDLKRFLNSLEATIQARTSALEELQATVFRTQKLNLLATLGAGQAHDMNNLLSVVKLSAVLVKEEAEEGRLPRAVDLQRLEGAADQASRLAQNLMAYGRQGEHSPECFDLNGKLGAMKAVLERLATRPVAVVWDLTPDPLLLNLDPVQVEQVMVNLVVNARDAMPSGGSLRITTRRRPDPPAALLEVVDTGTGIPPEILDRLFEPFFSTKAPGKGTGLGLASVKAIAGECGATVAVASEWGKGASFTVAFPLADAT